MSASRRVGVAATVALALCLAGALLLRRRPPPDTAPARLVTRPTPAGTLPRDPLAWVPASARTLIVADLPSLRRAAATRRWFTSEPAAGAHCAATLARRITTLALVLPRVSIDDFAFVAAGDVSPDDLSRCVPEAATVNRDGVALRVLRSARDDGGVGETSLVWTPSGVVLVGSSAIVAAMLDRGFDAMRGAAAPLSLDPLRRHVRDGAAVWALTLPIGAAPAGDPIAAVSAGAFSARVTDALSLDGVLLCDDSAHARRVADALTNARDGVLRELTSAPLRALAEGARAETDGARVNLRASLDAASLATAVSALDELAQGLERFLPTGPRGR